METRTPHTPHGRRDIARHAAMVLAFNTLLWVLQVSSGLERWGHWDRTLVYTQSIGFSIWALIEFGRLPLLNPGRPHWPSRPRAILLVLGGVLGGFIVGSLIGDWYAGAAPLSFANSQPSKLRSSVIFTAMASVIATYFFYSRGKAAVQREQIARAERDATLAKLALLQSQLEPHMLFNTLANLRVLIGLDPARAQAMLDRLIAFLRATLNASRSQAHSLSAEFERLDDYLQLMAVRMGPRLQARFELPPELRDTPVPPLLLQPLVENSIQHGLEPKVQGGRIEVAAQREGDTLVLTVRDTGVGPDEAPPSNGTKFGLKQVRERLATLFGEAASLELRAMNEAEGGGALVTVRLPMAPQA